MLDSGADDHLASPFDELLARLRALCRRHVDTDRYLRVPGGVLEVDLWQVSVPDGPVVRLSARECALLATLARQRSRSSTPTYTTSGARSAGPSSPQCGDTAANWVHFVDM
ncbi:MAG TPA: hypothetical protein VFW65_02860 [Pseudonocardiaceae bacterium]|nr:hypothetical protein [Pseudonocardiaceae bacterium]